VKILIIGGCGYIGSALFAKFCNNSNYQVTTVDVEWFGNFINPNNIKLDFGVLDENFLAQYNTIILVAANSSVSLCKDIKDAYDNNVTKFINLVSKLKKQKFIYASSSCVYVTSDNLPKTEDDVLSPMDGLTLTKTTIDQYMPLTDIEYYGLRFGSVNGYSPNMRLDLMINAMTISSKTKGEVNVMNGYANRPILSTNDLIRAVDTIVNSNEDKRGVYNLASVNHNILEIGNKVATHTSVPLVDKGNNFTYDFSINSEKFMREFNFKFNDTVETIVDNILSNPHNDKWQKRDTK
jgi:nucleoside-diphosphate-sugar epimerase